jgi:SAM-dependent methyltransferase
VSFAVGVEAYDRFMGRYSMPLAPAFVAFAGLAGDERVLDVGCGSGALTAELVGRGSAVAAVDPSEGFVGAVRARHPGVRVETAAAETLPFESACFDAALAQLVVHFMADPVAGLREMLRVTRRGGVVAACVWDYSEGGAPLSLFWEAARSLDAAVADESGLPGVRRGALAELLHAAGARDVVDGALSVEIEHESFEEWWEPFLLGVGPAGSYAAALDPERRTELRERCRALLPPAPFVVRARAWAARGRA